MEKLIISAAITGGMTVPGQSPAIPIAPEEIVESAVGAYEAGVADQAEFTDLLVGRWSHRSGTSLLRDVSARRSPRQLLERLDLFER